MQRIKSMRSTRCAEHRNSICAQGLRLAPYKGSHATAARLCTEGWLPDGVRQPRLTGETYEDAQRSRSCSPERYLRSQGGQRQAYRLVSPGKGLPTFSRLLALTLRL